MSPGEAESQAGERSRGPGQAARREHSLLALADLGRSLDLRLEETDLAQLGLYNLVGHFGIPRAALWLRDEESSRLRAACLVGVPAVEAAALGGQLESVAPRWTTGEIVRLSRAPWLGEFANSARERGLRIVARLQGREEPLGFVALGDPLVQRLDGDVEGDLIEASLAILAAAVENRRLVRRVHRRNEELATASERLEALDHARSELLSNLNHEFRTPIAVILGAASCLRDTPADGAQAERFLDMIETQAGALRVMITQLLDHAELMSVRASLQCVSTDVASCARALAARRQAASARSRREVLVVAGDERCLAAADPARLDRLLDELVENALKHSTAPSAVTIEVRRRDGTSGPEIDVAVRDHGRGMTPEELAMAFEPFRQGDASSTRRSGGLGIGLPLCRRMAELMGGSLTLESEFGRGTVARLVLRAVPGPEARAAAENGPHA